MRAQQIAKAAAPPLVFADHGKVWTTSLLIAEKFGKRHSHVLDSIAKLDCEPSFTEPNFRLSEYTDSTGRKLSMYRISEAGFMLLGMSFTGKKAVRWKIALIHAFQQMRSELVRIHSNHQNLAWQQTRVQGKALRHGETESIAAFVAYATAQGSQNAARYYRHFSELTRLALGCPSAPGSMPWRDGIDARQLVYVAVLDDQISTQIQQGMRDALPYKSVYQNCKHALADTALALGIGRSMGAHA